MNLDDKTFLQQLGFAIREIRTARDMTQAKLAEMSGLHRTFIGSVERGERNVAILSLRRIAHALHTPLSELMPSRSKPGK